MKALYDKWHLGEDPPYYTDIFREHREYARSMSSIFQEVRKRPRVEVHPLPRWGGIPVRSPQRSGRDEELRHELKAWLAGTGYPVASEIREGSFR